MRLGKSLFDAKQAMNLLKGCPICSSLDSGSVATIAAMASERAVAKGESLMTEGEPCTGFFLVLSGKVRVYKTSPSGREKALLIAEVGMTFGEDSLFGQGEFLENAAALERSTVLHVPRKEFLEKLRSDPELSFQVMESLCGWIRRLSTSVENVAFLGARDKVVRYLVELAGRNGPGKVDFPEKKKAIADRLGITPETFSRVIRELEEKSLLKVSGKVFEVLDGETLEEELEHEISTARPQKRKDG